MPRKQGRSVRLDKAVAEFFKGLESEKLSQSTLNSKHRTLTALQETVGRVNHSTRKLTDDHVIETLNRLAMGATDEENETRRRKGLAPRTGRRPATLAADRTNLKQFIGFLKNQEWVAASFDPLYRITKSSRPAGDTPAGRIYHKRNVPFSKWAELLERAGEIHPRTRAVVALGLFCGRRASEIALLQFKHVDMNHRDDEGDLVGRIEFFNVKRGRTVSSNGTPIAPWLREELERYFAWYHEQCGELRPDWYVIPAVVPPWGSRSAAPWPLDPPQQVHTRRVTDSVRRALIQFGWTEDMLYHEGEHTLRRSHQIHAQETGGAEAAQASGDHQSPRETYTYTGNRPGQRAFERAVKAWEKPADPAPAVPAQASAPPQERMAEVIDLFSRRKVG